MKSRSLTRVVLALSFVLPAAVSALPTSAKACGGEVYLETNPNTMLVAQAEQLLSQGKLNKAAEKAVQAFPALKIVKVGSTNLSDRALRIMALAASRAEGSVTAGAMKAKDHEANMAWSVATLKAIDAKRPNNPSIQTDLAEVMSRVPEHKEAALKMLSELSDKDLITSAEGYAALGRLKAAAGDSKAREAAVKRCETMTKSPDQVCVVPAA